MENITGQNNEFTLIFPHNRIALLLKMTNSIRLLIRPTSQSQETTIVSQCISTLKKVRKNCCLATDYTCHYSLPWLGEY